MIKTYAELTHATKLMIDDYGGINTFGNNGNERLALFRERLPKYIKLDYEKYVIRWNVRSFTGAPGVQRGHWYYMPNGAVLILPESRFSGDCIQTEALDVKGNSERYDGRSLFYGTYQHACGEFEIDLNGTHGPNVRGKDIFAFALVIDGVVPLGSSKESIWTQTFDGGRCINPRQTEATNNCAAWVIYNKNMDYLHCNNLSWNGPYKCQ